VRTFPRGTVNSCVLMVHGSPSVLRTFCNSSRLLRLPFGSSAVRGESHRPLLSYRSFHNTISTLASSTAKSQPPSMTVRASKFTPEVLLSAPRRSAAIPSPDGKLAAFTVSTYSFQSHSKASEIRILDIKTGQSKVLVSDSNASEPTWLGEKNEILWLKAGDKGTTSLLLANADSLDTEYVIFPKPLQYDECWK